MIELADQEETPPLCKDCVHMIPYADNTLDLAKCGRSVRLLNPITGAEDRRFCETERGDAGDCGPYGRRYQPKADHQNPT